LRFSYLFLVGRIVTLRPRLCKDYLPGRALKICGAVNKEDATPMTWQKRRRSGRLSEHILGGTLKST